MKLYNRNFGVGERIEYMGWVNEAVSNSNQPWQSYRPRFLALKGPDLLLFETPPVSIINLLNDRIKKSSRGINKPGNKILVDIIFSVILVTGHVARLRLKSIRQCLE